MGNIIVIYKYLLKTIRMISYTASSTNILPDIINIFPFQIKSYGKIVNYSN